MNNQLIEKIITANGLSCPEFIYENPVLDRNVAKALSKSFVKILNLPLRSSSVNHRISVLEHIKNHCQLEPEYHLRVDDNLIHLLIEVHEENIKESRNSSSDKSLDAFLIRNVKDKNIESCHGPPINPEIFRALINLNKDGEHLEPLLQDIIHWNSSEKKYIHILKDIWSNVELVTKSESYNDFSIKMKPEIEKILLDICQSVLNETNKLDVENLFLSDDFLKKLVKRSSDSSHCFQICCSVLNYLFIMTNFNTRLQLFIQTFVKHVKDSCSLTTFSVLYPTQVSHIVVLLDMDIDLLPASLKSNYIDSTKKYLLELSSESENDLIMLLSHFPQWFDIYFEENV